MSQRRLRFGLLAAGLLAVLSLLAAIRLVIPSTRISSGTEIEAPSSSDRSASSQTPEPRGHGRASRRLVEDKWDVRWRQLAASNRTDRRDGDMAIFLEELAAFDPQRALALAGNEADPELRQTLLEAALRGWGRGAEHPEDAVAWARTQTLLDDSQAIASIFQGAAADPDKALQLARELSEQEPEKAGDYGGNLVAALARARQFDRAAGFATSAPEEVRLDLLNAAYSHWADSDPTAALKNLGTSSDPTVQSAAFAAVMSRWARNDAKAATEHALTLPEGSDRTLALSMSLRNWAAVDAPAAAAWILRFDPSPELDFGAAILASSPDTLTHPEVATSWAESIVDPRLRVRVLAGVVREWAAVDPIAAQRYAWTSPGIRLEDRLGVLAAFEPGFEPLCLLP